MKMMKDCGLVDSRKDGIWVKYSVNHEKLDELKDFSDYGQTKHHGIIHSKAGDGNGDQNLGPGAELREVQANANEALKKIGMEATIIKVEDPKEIAKYGIMQTPGLVINEKVVSYGRILTPKHIAELLQK